MWTKTHTKVYHGVKAADVWRLWTDVNHWHLWDAHKDYCRMTEPFQKGSKFILKPKGMGEVTIELVEVEDGKSFIDCATFPGAKMYDAHMVEETADGVRITTTTTVTGWLSFLWAQLVGKKVAAKGPAQIEALVALARKKNG